MARPLVRAFVQLRADDSLLKGDVTRQVGSTATRAGRQFSGGFAQAAKAGLGNVVKVNPAQATTEGAQAGRKFSAGFTRSADAAGKSGSRGFLRSFSGGVKDGIRQALSGESGAGPAGAAAGRKWSAGFRRGAETGGGAGGGKGGLLGGILGGSLLKGGLAGAAVAAGAGIFASIKTGITQAAANEQAIIGFDTLLPGGQQVAQKFFADLTKFAAATPFELPGLVDAARQLLGVGVAAKDVQPDLTALGNASSALGLDQERFGRVMLATTQIMSAGKVQAGDLQQITEAGIPVWQLLAKATGKPIPVLRDLASKGKLLASDTLPLLFAQMNKDYGGAMTKQSKTLNGVWSTVKDTFKNSLATALLPLVPVLTDLLPKGADLFARALGGLSGIIKTGVVSVQAFFAAFKEGDVTSDGVVGGFERVGDALHTLTGGGGLGGLGALGKGFSDLKSTAGPAIAGLVGPLKDFAVSVSPPLIKAGREIGTVLGGALSSIGKIISQDLAPAFAAFLPAVAPVVRFLLSVFGGAVVGALKGIVKIVEGVLKILAGLFNVIGGVLTGDWSRVWLGIKQIVSGALHAIFGIIQFIWNVGIIKLFRLGFALLRGIATGGWQILVAIFRGSLSGVGRLITGGWALFRGLFGRGFTALAGLARSGMSAVGRFISGGMSAVGSFFSRGFTGAVSIVRSAFGRVVSGVSSGISGAVRTVAGLPRRIVGALGNLGSLLYGAGQRVIQGLIDGVLSRISGIAAAISRAASVVRSFWPFSPAKQGPLKQFPMEKAGRNIVTGLAQGLADTRPISRASSALASAASLTVNPSAIGRPAGLPIPTARSGGSDSLAMAELIRAIEALAARPVVLSTGQLVSAVAHESRRVNL